MKKLLLGTLALGLAIGLSACCCRLDRPSCSKPCASKYDKPCKKRTVRKAPWRRSRCTSCNVKNRSGTVDEARASMNSTLDEIERANGK